MEFALNCKPGWLRMVATAPEDMATGSLGIKDPTGALIDVQATVKTAHASGLASQVHVIAKILTAGVYTLVGDIPASSKPAMPDPVWPAASARFMDGGVQYVAQLPVYTMTTNWTRGPLANEQRVVVVPTKVLDGTPHHLVQVRFDVCSMVDNSTRVVYSLSNSRDLPDDAAVQMANLTLTLGSSTVYTHPSPKLFHGQLFIKGPYGVGYNAARVHASSEMYWQNGVFPRVSQNVPNVTGLDSNGLSYDLGMFGEMTDSETAPGGRWELAPLDDILAMNLAHPSDDKQDRILANGRCGGSWDGYLLQADGLTINRLTENIDYMPYKAGFEQYHALNPPHLPSLFVAPYLYSGDPVFLDLMKSWAAFVCSDCWNDPEQTSGSYSSDMIVRYGRHANGMVCNLASSFAAEVRGLGRGLRMIIDAYLCTPDADTVDKAYFKLVCDQQAQWLDGMSLMQGGGFFNPPFIWADPGNGDGYGAVRNGYASVALWQQYELLFALQHAQRNGIPGGTGYMRQLCSCLLSLFLVAPVEFWPLLITLYYPRFAIHFLNGNHTPLSTWPQFYQANYTGNLDSHDVFPPGTPGPPYYVPMYWQILKQAEKFGMPGVGPVLAWVEANYGGNIVGNQAGYALVDAAEEGGVVVVVPPVDPPVTPPTPPGTARRLKRTARIVSTGAIDLDPSSDLATGFITVADAVVIVPPPPPPPAPTPKADVRVSQWTSIENPKVGQLFTLTTHVFNTGPDAAPNVVIDVTLEAPWGIIAGGSAGPLPDGVDATTGLWTLGNMKNLEEREMSLQVVVTA